MSGNGSNGVQGVVAKPCDVCGVPCSGIERAPLCEFHYEAWRQAKESIRANEAAERGARGAVTAAYEDFVRRKRAERLNEEGRAA